ncbi:MAG: sulfatase-like hydrolase/transferase [Fuerstiella sp.]
MSRFAAFLIFLISSGLSACAADPPNILFIFTDDHAYQAISAYGSKINVTPNIDRIARDGMRFDRCYVPNSICGQPDSAAVQQSMMQELARLRDELNVPATDPAASPGGGKDNPTSRVIRNRQKQKP